MAVRDGTEAGFSVHIKVCELFRLRFRFVSRRANFGDHDTPTYNLQTRINSFLHASIASHSLRRLFLVVNASRTNRDGRPLQREMTPAHTKWRPSRTKGQPSASIHEPNDRSPAPPPSQHAVALATP